MRFSFYYLILRDWVGNSTIVHTTHILPPVPICAIMCRRAINEQIYSEQWKIYYANAIHHHISYAKFSSLRVARLSISFWKLFAYDCTPYIVHTIKKWIITRVQLSYTNSLSHTHDRDEFLSVQLFQSFDTNSWLLKRVHTVPYAHTAAYTTIYTLNCHLFSSKLVIEKRHASIFVCKTTSTIAERNDFVARISW